MERGGGGRRAGQREMLQDYARNLKDMLPTVGYTLARVAQILRGMRGAFDTMGTHGPAKQGRIVSFLKLYPNMFEIQGSGPNIKVFVAKPLQPRPVVPRPVQIGLAVAVGRLKDSRALSKSILELHTEDFRMIKRWSMALIQPDKGHLDTGGMKNTEWLLQ